MKNLKNTITKTMLVVFAFFSITTFLSCSADDGKDGATGTANVISTPWVQRNFTVSGSTYSCNVTNIPQITTEIIESGTILSYQKSNVGGIIQTVPLQVASAYIQIGYNIGGFISYSNFDASAQYRHIIIPAGINIAGRGISTPDYSKMTYQEICTMFTIPQ